MGNSLKKVLALTFLFLATSPAIANSAEIPLLTWERGQIQEVILGGEAAIETVRVELQGNGIKSIPFEKVGTDGQGIDLYSLNIPDDTRLGGYSIVKIDETEEFTVIAGVNLIEKQTYVITREPLDLAIIISVFTFLTALVSSLRARKYSHIAFLSTQRMPEDSIYFDTKGISFLDRIALSPYRLRVRAINNLPKTIFKFLLLKEGELVHRISPKAFGVLPSFGFLAGLIAVNETQRAGGIGNAGMAIFIGVALVGILDAFSGLVAVLSFWFCQLAIGNVLSLRDILIMIAVGISWLLPPLFASIFQTAGKHDFIKKDSEELDLRSKFFATSMASILGGAIFYFGQTLVNSLLGEVIPSRNISVLAVLVTIIAIFIRGIANEIYLARENTEVPEAGPQIEEIIISRVSSPTTAFTIFLMTFLFPYIWTGSTQKSFIIALIFTTPYLLLLVRFNEIKSKLFARAKRNILLEGIVVAGATFVIFSQVSGLPLVSEEKALFFLILSGIPGLAHAIYSAACDSSDRQEIIV